MYKNNSSLVVKIKVHNKYKKGPCLRKKLVF